MFKARFKRVLDPIDRVLEVLGGVIMVLTFTGALSVSSAGEADVRQMRWLSGLQSRVGHNRRHHVSHELPRSP